MNTLFFLIPIALILGAIWLAIFMWTLKSGQYDDLDGAAWRALKSSALKSTAPTSAHVAMFHTFLTFEPYRS